MKPTCLIPVLALVAFAIAGCSKNEPSASRADDTPAAAERGAPAAASSPKAGDVDGIASAYMTDLEKLSGLFQQVTDEASAKRHAPEIKATSDRLHGYGDQLQAADPTKRGMAFMPHVQRMMKIQQEMAPALARISNDPALSQHLGDALKMPKVN